MKNIGFGDVPEIVVVTARKTVISFFETEEGKKQWLQSAKQLYKKASFLGDRL